MKRLLTVVAFLSVAGWLLNLLEIYWPFLSGQLTVADAQIAMGNLWDNLSRQVGRPQDISRDTIQAQYLLELTSWAIVRLLGLLMATAALFLPARRALFVSLSASIYLVPWVSMFSDFVSSMTVFKTYELKLMTAQTFGTVWGFVLKDVALPVLFGIGFLAGIGSALANWKQSDAKA